jgi:hypothetical protein
VKKELLDEAFVPVLCGGERHLVGIHRSGPLRLVAHKGTSCASLMQMWELMGKPNECGCARLVAYMRQPGTASASTYYWVSGVLPNRYDHEKVGLTSTERDLLDSQLRYVHSSHEQKHSYRHHRKETDPLPPGFAPIPRDWAKDAEELRQKRVMETVTVWLDRAAVPGASYAYDLDWNTEADVPVRTRFSRRRSDGQGRVALTVNSKLWRDMPFRLDDTGKVLITGCVMDEAHWTRSRYKEMVFVVTGVGYEPVTRSFVRKTGTVTYNTADTEITLIWKWSN